MSELPSYVETDERAERSALLLPLLAASLILALIGIISVATDGGDGGVSDPTALIRSAPDALEEAGSARMSMTMGMDTGGMSMDFGGEGAIDFVTGAMTFAMSFMGQDIEMRTDGETLWMQLPGDALPAGVQGSWVEVPLAELPGATGGFGAAPSESYTEILRGISSDVEELGREEVNGVDANHYRFDVSIDAALEQIPEEDRADVERSFEALGGADTLPIELWISDGGLPVRQVMEMELTDDVMTGTMRVQVDLTDFGVEVDVEPPPAEEVISFDEHPELEEVFGSGEVS